MMKNRAIVTGANGGVGRALVKRLHETCDIIVCIDPKYKTDAEIESGEDGIVFQYRMDAGQVGKLATLRGDLEQRGLRWFNWIVNCSGFNRIAPISDVTEPDWDAVYNANVKGPFFTIRTFLEPMRRSPPVLSKRIVNMLSIAAQIPHTRSSAYNSSKAAMRMLVKQMGRELAPEKIIVSGVSPCIIEGTPMTEDVYNQLSVIRQEPLATLEANYLKRVPGGRYVRVDEVVGAILWLLSPDASYCVGTDLEVAGGMM